MAFGWTPRIITVPNAPVSYDTNWMRINREAVVGNLLWGTGHYTRDGMFEHAVERIFGHVVVAHEYEICGVDGSGGLNGLDGSDRLDGILGMLEQSDITVHPAGTYATACTSAQPY